MEVDSATRPGDWTRRDREEGTEAWHRAQLHLMCQACALPSPADAKRLAALHFKTIVQRAAVYNWFDLVRAAQGHEIVWPATAWLVASQFARFDKIGHATEVMTFTTPFTGDRVTIFRADLGERADRGLTTAREWTEGVFERDGGRILASGSTLDDMVAFANAGNKRIFEDVWSTHFVPVFRKGLAGQRIVGSAAEKWDSDMVDEEQLRIIEPEYIKHVKHGNPRLGKLLNELMTCEDFVKIDRAIKGQLGLCRSGLDVMNPHDRVFYGKHVVVPFYKRAAADGTYAKMRPEQAYAIRAPITCG